MATMDEWAAFINGAYQGRIRSSACDWEDLIGSVKLECTPSKEGCLNVTITIIEFGTWAGRLSPKDGVMEGSIGQGDISFKLTFQARGQSEEIQGCFYGGIYTPAGEQLFELHLASDWRKRSP